MDLTQEATKNIKLVEYSDTESCSTVEEETRVGNRGRQIVKRRSGKTKLEKCVGAKKSIKANPCHGRKCPNSCNQFSEEERVLIFDYYWGLASGSRQKYWLSSSIERCCIQRKRGLSQQRNISYKYYINFNGKRTKVCQQFLLKTLDLSQMTLRHLVKTQSYKKVPKYRPHNKTSAESIDIVHKFIENLPAVPSHYCRNKSSKLYLPQELRNIPTVYKLYKEQLTLNNQVMHLISLAVFRKIFKKDFHLGFHLPKKDKCSLCEKVSHMDIGCQSDTRQTEAYKKHILEKELSKETFLRDQAKSKEVGSKFLCSSFDLQKVLYTPHGSSVNLYYSRKYHYFNESIYESGTKKGYCFLWGETDGRRGCNEIASIIYLYLKDLDKQQTHDTVSLFCDSCPGQNRNRAVLSMISFFLEKSVFVTKIKITYLLPGHTMMPVDSVHSTIESFIKKRSVWSPSEWEPLIRNSRTNPSNYLTRCIEFSEFRDWKSFAKLLLPDEVKIKFSTLRCVQFDKSSPYIKLYYGYSENSQTQTIKAFSQRTLRNQRVKKHGPNQLYHGKLPLSEAKLKDLNNLCIKGIIPMQFQKEYKEMSCCRNVKDTLAETDNEDENDVV